MPWWKTAIFRQKMMLPCSFMGLFHGFKAISTVLQLHFSNQSVILILFLGVITSTNPFLCEEMFDIEVEDTFDIFCYNKYNWPSKGSNPQPLDLVVLVLYHLSYLGALCFLFVLFFCFIFFLSEE